MGRGKAAATLRIIEAATEILEEIQPASVRAVCYQLFRPHRLIPSMAKSETNKVSAHLTWAREHGEIPWDWIVDDTRRPERVYSFAEPEAFMRDSALQFRKDHWSTQPYHVEVWSEKGTISGTLSPIIKKKYGVPFRVMHGHGSATAIHDAAEESADMGKRFIVLYVGDYDPSGMHMSAVDLPERTDRYGGSVEIVRVALDAEDLLLVSTFPARDKIKDPRYSWFVSQYGQTCAELDALNPNILRQRVDASISLRIDAKAWGRSELAGKAQGESIKAYLNAWGKSA
jgi:hypothetical protein